MITISFSEQYLPVLIVCVITFVTGLNAMSDPIANVIRGKAQTTSEVFTSVTVGLILLVVAIVALVITWPT